MRADVLSSVRRVRLCSVWACGNGSDDGDMLVCVDDYGFSGCAFRMILITVRSSLNRITVQATAVPYVTRVLYSTISWRAIQKLNTSSV